MFDQIKRAQEQRRAQIYGAFKNADEKGATLIIKAEFEKEYPASQYEIYSLPSLTKFREDLNKSEDIEDKDAAFKEATKDFKHFLVLSEGVKQPMFVRKKVAGE